MSRLPDLESCTIAAGTAISSAATVRVIADHGPHSLTYFIMPLTGAKKPARQGPVFMTARLRSKWWQSRTLRFGDFLSEPVTTEALRVLGRHLVSVEAALAASAGTSRPGRMRVLRRSDILDPGAVGT
jgi:hypothetical protein